MMLAMKQKRLPIDFYIPRTLIIAFLIIIGTISSLFGCATIGEPQYVSESDAIGVVPTQTFDLPTLLTANNCPSIDVQLIKPGEVSKVSPENAVSGAFYGLFGGAFLVVGGIVSSPPYGLNFTELAVAVASGGALGAILGAAIGSENSNDHSIVSKAFQETDFSAKIKYILEKNLSSYFPEKPDGTTEIKLLILGYGFSNKGFDNLVFHFEADIRVKQAEELVFQDFIFWSAHKRSEDMPPPGTAGLHDFAKGDGELMGTMLKEASEVIAASVLKRLKVPYEASSQYYNIHDDRHLLRVQHEASGSSNQ